MPTHIAGYRSRLDVKMALAKSALARLTKPRKGERLNVRITGEMLEYVSDANPRGIYNFSERFPVSNVNVVEVSTMQFTSQKERKAFCMYLKRIGFTCTAKNTYAKNATLQAGKTF